MPGTSKLPPFRHRVVEIPDIRIHVAELETPGKPLVMLHGIGMDWRVWQAASRRLVPGFHLYLVDLRGHGESDKPRHGYSLLQYAADVEDLVDQLDLRDAALLGSSLGGMVAISVEAPADVISHRVLVDPPMTGGPVRDADMFRDILRLKRGSPELLAAYLERVNPRAGTLLTQTMSDMWHEAADGVLEDALSDPNGYFNVDSALAGDESKTLIMRADPAMGGVLTAEQADRAVALLRNGALSYVQGAGHAIHATKPNEFARAVHEFILG